MVSARSIDDQLKKLHFKRGWNRPETDELASILLPDEEILECVNGWYEGGYAILCATNIRVLLIDKKPFKFLNVEDLRFNTINQIDYSHRMLNASIHITSGMKILIFRSYNQPRLRKLISHVQHEMAEIKKDEPAEKAKDQGSVPELDQQLRAYLLSQYEQHQSLRMQHEPSLPPINSNEEVHPEVSQLPRQVVKSVAPDTSALVNNVTASELYQDGVKEIFGKYQADGATNPVKTAVSFDSSDDPLVLYSANEDTNLVINPLKIAYSKLPQILSSKRRKQSATST